MTTDADHPAPPPCVVCIPARNEAERLPRLLASLAAQNGVSARAPLRVVVLANNCTDGTVQAVRDVEASGILATLTLRLIAVDLVGADAHVGTARRMALDAGADWLEADGEPDGILLTTDADARLPAEWVAANLRALEAADIVGGRLVIDDDGTPDPALADLHARIERYWSGVRRLEDLLDPPPYDPAPATATIPARASPFPRSCTGLWADCRRCPAARTTPSSGCCAPTVRACATARTCRSWSRPAIRDGSRAAWPPRCSAGPASSTERPTCCRRRPTGRR